MVVLKIALLLCCATAIHGSQKIVCDLNDSQCTTTAADKNWYNESTGYNGRLRSSEPIGPKILKDTSEKLDSVFSETFLIGLSKCKVPYLSIDTENLTMDYQIHCDHLLATADFQWKGLAGDKSVDGSGSLTCDHYDYLFTINANYETYIGEDGEMYMNFLDDYKIDCMSNDNIVWNLTYDNDEEKSKEVTDYMNENWQLMEKEFGTAAMKELFKTCVENSNDYMADTPAKDMFSYYKDDEDLDVSS